jgi:hypothetical protein
MTTNHDQPTPERTPSAMTRLPDFIIIGAMKSATSTLQSQLVAHPGIVMSTPKEPKFFSDDPIWERGMGWYTNLFSAATADDLCGEASTHYTKLPTYPHTVDRMVKHVPNARLVYVMRQPIDRLVSQYIHQWTEREISVDINDAIDQHPELVAYSSYSMQLAPFLEHWAPQDILPVFFEHMRAHPQAALERICDHIGYTQPATWDDTNRHNVSAERLRQSPLRDAIVEAPGLSHLRKAVVPQSVRNRVKSRWQMTDRPELSVASRKRLTKIFDDDLVQLSERLGTELRCDNWVDKTRNRPLEWDLPQSFSQAA